MDIIKDKGFINLIRIKVAHPTLVPGYVESADLDNMYKEASGLAPSQFALPATMEYPLNNKEATWTSAAYFAREHRNNPAAFEGTCWGNIKRASRIWGIDEDVEDIKQAYTNAPTTKEASDNEVWGWVANGEQKYPLHTTSMTKEAMEYFTDNRDKYPRDMRTKIARAIYSAAGRFGVKACDVIRKEAGVGFPNRVAVVNALKDRADRIRPTNEKLASTFSGYAEAIATCPTSELFAMATKCAEAVEFYDKEAGFHYNYRMGSTKCVERPTDSFFAVTKEAASDIVNNFINVNGEMLDCTKIAEFVKEEDFDKPFGEGFFKRKVKDLSEKRALSPDDKPSVIVHRVISSLSDSDRWVLGNHLASL